MPKTRNHFGNLYAVCVWHPDVFAHKLSNRSASCLNAGYPQCIAHRLHGADYQVNLCRSHVLGQFYSLHQIALMMRCCPD